MEPEKEKKSVLLRLSKKDYELIKECAWTDRLSISGWIRNVIVGEAISKGAKP